MSDDLMNWLVRSCAITPENVARHSGRALAIAESCDRLRQRWSSSLGELQEQAECIAECLLAASIHMKRQDDAERAAEQAKHHVGPVHGLPGAAVAAEESGSRV